MSATSDSAIHSDANAVMPNDSASLVPAAATISGEGV